MIKFWKCFVILLAGSLTFLIADALTDYRGELFTFVGPLIPLAVIISAIISNEEKYRKIGAAVMFWAGIAALFIYTLLYTETGAKHPENWGVVIVCFIEGIGLGALIYYLKATKSRKKLFSHYNATFPARRL